MSPEDANKPPVDNYDVVHSGVFESEHSILPLDGQTTEQSEIVTTKIIQLYDEQSNNILELWPMSRHTSDDVGKKVLQLFGRFKLSEFIAGMSLASNCGAGLYAEQYKHPSPTYPEHANTGKTGSVRPRIVK